MTNMKTCAECGMEYDDNLFFVVFHGFPCYPLKQCQDCAKEDPRLDEVIPYTEEDLEEMGIVQIQ